MEMHIIFGYLVDTKPWGELAAKVIAENPVDENFLPFLLGEHNEFEAKGK